MYWKIKYALSASNITRLLHNVNGAFKFTFISGVRDGLDPDIHDMLAHPMHQNDPRHTVK